MPDTASDWKETIKKEARGTDDSDFGEVQDIGNHYVVTQKGVVNKERFFIPKYCVEGFDGHTLYFNATESDLRGWQGEEAQADEYYTKYRESASVKGEDQFPEDLETRIPLIKERVAKTADTSEGVVKKERITETVPVDVTHEKLVVEKEE